MQLDLETRKGLSIRSFSDGQLRINELVITSPVIVSPEEILGEWSPPPMAKLSIADFQPCLEQEPEVILFGTGVVQRFPDSALITEILRLGIGFEIMDTAAASRTFNVLASEYRRVIAALLIR